MKRGRSNQTQGKANEAAAGLPLTAFLRRRQWRQRGTALVVIGGLVALAVADRRGLFLYEGDDLTRYDGREATVRRVIDGDTLVVAIPDRREPTTTIRLWGIDAPELADPDTGEPAEPLAKQAAKLARSLATGRTVTLHLEPHRVRGNFGRILAYVELPDGSRLAEHLLKQGLATFDDRWQHEHYRRYRLIEQQAHTQNKGLWSQPSSE